MLVCNARLSERLGPRREPAARAPLASAAAQAASQRRATLSPCGQILATRQARRDKSTLIAASSAARGAKDLRGGFRDF